MGFRRLGRMLGAGIFTLIVALNVMGCEEDPMMRGRAALLGEKPKVAKEAFDKVLKDDPDNLEARRLMGEVLRLQGDFAQAEKRLLEIWTEQGFGDEGKDLAPEQKSLKGRMSQQLEDVYIEWAESIDPKESPEKFEEIVTKGLERDAKNPRLNTMMVEHLISRGERLVEEGKKLEAAEAFEGVLNYRALPTQAEAAEERADNLRLEVFSNRVREQFAKELKPQLVEAEDWSEERKAVSVSIETEVDRSLKPGSEADVKAARAAARPAVALGLGATIARITGVEIKQSHMEKLGWPKHALDSEDFRRGRYKVNAYVALDDAIAYGFKAAEMNRENAARPAAEGEADNAPADSPDAGAAGADDAGSE